MKLTGYETRIEKFETKLKELEDKINKLEEEKQELSFRIDYLESDMKSVMYNSN